MDELKLTEAELRALLLDLESDRVERTISFAKESKFGEAICAFANDFPNHGQPGYLIIGADDKGKVVGVRVTDELLKTLGGFRSNGNILFPPAMKVGKFVLPEGELAVVEVFPSDMPPVRFDGRIWIRVGPRKAIATEQEERILNERRAAHFRTYDQTPVQGTSLDDLSLRLFEEYRSQAVAPDVIEANHRTTEQALAALRFFDLKRGLVNVAGLLLFGTNARYHLLGAYVQFLKFPGTSMGEIPSDQVELSGDLASIIRLLHEKIRAYNRVGMEPGEGLRDRLLPDYPEWAVRELLHNALIHRDYTSANPVRIYWFDDRIEITNPGGLYGGMKAEEMRTGGGAYRNPVIAEAFKVLGFVNRFGHGVTRAEELLRQSGNPAPEFKLTDSYFQVVIPRARRLA